MVSNGYACPKPKLTKMHCTYGYNNALTFQTQQKVDHEYFIWWLYTYVPILNLALAISSAGLPVIKPAR